MSIFIFILSIFLFIHLLVIQSFDEFQIKSYENLDSEELYQSLMSINTNDSLIDYFNQSMSYTNEHSITVILNQYKRNNLNLQIQAILNQSYISNIKQIYVYQNENHVNINTLVGYYQIMSNIPIKLIHNVNENFRFHGRFTLPLLVDTEYIAILDDDIIPGSKYIENCIRVVTSYNSLCGSMGEIVGSSSKMHITVPERDIQVDYAMQSWVFRREWINALWQVKAFLYLCMFFSMLILHCGYAVYALHTCIHCL